MDLIDLALEKGLEPKKTSSHGGGEYHSACPNCKDGKDRFAKSPGDAFKDYGVNLREWILQGIEHQKFSKGDLKTGLKSKEIT